MARILLSKFEHKVGELKDLVKSLKKSEKSIGLVSIKNVLKGLKQVPVLPDYTCSSMDGDLRIWGADPASLYKQLPFPKAESMYWYLLTSEIPSSSEVQSLISDISNDKINTQSLEFLGSSLSSIVDPCTKLSLMFMRLQENSCFANEYKQTPRKDLYKPTFKDSLCIISAMPTMLSMVSQNSYIENQTEFRGISEDYCRINNITSEEARNFLDLALFVYADSGTGSVGAHVSKLIGSTHSDPYLSLAGAVTAISGPLHGGATDQVLKLLNSPVESWSNLSRIPGFGHSLLNNDTRVRVLSEFIRPDHEKLIEMQKRAKNLKMNPDALLALGQTKFNLETLGSALLASSRILGCLSTLMFERALEAPIEYSESVTIQELENI